MSSLFAFLLSAHVILGVVGVIASYATLLQLLKKDLSIKKLLWWSGLAPVSYILSWFSGGYYYVKYYGDQVKPVIKEGAYPWGHLVFMEAKEHIFLALPFATITIFGAILLKRHTLGQEMEFKKSLVVLSIVITILATIITLSGVIITGSSR